PINIWSLESTDTPFSKKFQKTSASADVPNWSVITCPVANGIIEKVTSTLPSPPRMTSVPEKTASPKEDAEQVQPPTLTKLVALAVRFVALADPEALAKVTTAVV